MIVTSSENSGGDMEEGTAGVADQMAVIKEIYNGVKAHEVFENELERAIQSRCDVIVIEPQALGEGEYHSRPHDDLFLMTSCKRTETARWIGMGLCLHKTSVATGTGALVSCYFWPQKPYIFCPLTGLSLFCAAFYEMSWKRDACSDYRRAGPDDMGQIAAQNVTSAQTPVVLIRRKDHLKTERSLVHSAISIIAFAVSAWTLYKWLRFVS